MASINSRIMPPQAAANVRVLVRVRPLNTTEIDSGSIGRTNVLSLKSSAGGSSGTDATIIVNSGVVEESSGARRRGIGSIGGNSVDCENNSGTKQFTVDAVHGQRSSQADVYDSVKEIVDAVISGYNGTIVAYGQTGSGKTHTVFGQDDGDDSKSGLVQRSLREIFHKVTLSEAKDATNDTSEVSGTTKTTFRSSFFEIFNERVYDLLSDESLEKHLAVREDSNRVYVEGLKEVEVTNTSEAENVLSQGMANRHVAATNMNRTSSRSHAVFVLSVKSEHIDDEGLRKIRNSKFTLVDLAGSERQKSTATFGERLKEASMINKSLLCLGHVINALVDREAGRVRHVPFRNSKLTFLLRDTWGGNSKTFLVATISPSGKSLGETLSTLQFAQRAKLIKNNAVLNEDTCGTVAALQAEVAKLRSQLAGSSATPSISNEEMPLSQSQCELMDALKRRALRAEDRVLHLEKQISEENSVKQTLKRKVSEEVMVRKFKERRLTYLQSNCKDLSSNDQHRMMNEEIACLQKRLDTPSAEAIEWKVAYEHVKESLDNQIEKDGMDIVMLEDKTLELETTIERLCSEKLALEGRVSALSLSSSDTKDEIDSILKEVDRLESEMTALQDENDHLKNKNTVLNKEAVTSEDQINRLQCDLDRSNRNGSILEKNYSQLQKSFGDLSEEVEKLNAKLEEKIEHIAELEMLSKEMESELQITIDDLGNKLNTSMTTIADKDSTIFDLKGQLSTMNKSNLDLSNQIKQASSQIDAEKLMVRSIEEKITHLESEKERAIHNFRNENDEIKEKYKKEIKSLQDEVKQTSEERDNLKCDISVIKGQAEMAHSTINERDLVIAKMKADIVHLKESQEEIDQAVHLEKDQLEDKLTAQKVVMEEMDAKFTMLKEEKQKALYKTEEEMENMRISLNKKKEEMEAEHHHWTREKKNLESNLAKAEAKYKEAECNAENQRILLQTMQATLNEVDVKRNTAIENAANEQKQIEKNCQKKIEQIQNNHDQMALQISTLNNALDMSKAEYDKVIEHLEKQSSLASSLREQLSKKENESNRYKSEMNMKILALEKHLDEILDRKSELEVSLGDKTSKLGESSKALFDQKQLLVKIQNDNEAVQISQEEKVKSYILKINHLVEEKKMMETEVENCKKEIKLLNDKCHDDMEKKSLAIESQIEKYRVVAYKSAAELECKHSHIQALEENIKLLQSEKKTANIESEENLKKLQVEQEILKEKTEKYSSSEKQARDELLLQKDRIKLLNRRNETLEFELKALQENQDTLNDQKCIFETQNEELRRENDHIKNHIERITSSTEHVTNMSPIKQPHTPFKDLATKMDNMLEKITVDQSMSMDETFDESLFLPNAATNEDKENENVNSNTPTKLYSKSTALQLSTPQKMTTITKSDCQNKRLPLTERKSIGTPQRKKRTTPLKALTSSKKHAKGLSATKLRTNWMLFDNRKLFQSEKKSE